MTSSENGRESKSHKKTINFHGDAVANVVIVLHTQKKGGNDTAEIKTFNALQDPLPCQMINIQVVADFVTITFYRDEQAKSVIRRELIPSHKIDRILIEDLTSDVQ